MGERGGTMAPPLGVTLKPVSGWDHWMEIPGSDGRRSRMVFAKMPRNRTETARGCVLAYPVALDSGKQPEGTGGPFK